MKRIQQSLLFSNYVTWHFSKLMALGVIITYAITFIFNAEQADFIFVLQHMAGILVGFYILIALCAMMFFGERDRDDR